MDFNYDEWVQNIKRLQKNRENVPEDVLKTKYAKPYGELIQTIKKQTSAMVAWAAIPDNLPIIKNQEDQKDIEDITTRAQSIISLHGVMGTYKKIEHAIFSEYNPGMAVYIAGKIWNDIERDAYGPYWQKHCSLRKDGTEIYNDIVGMIWVSPDLWRNEEGTCFEVITWPPPKEMVEAVERRKNGDQDHRIQE